MSKIVVAVSLLAVLGFGRIIESDVNDEPYIPIEYDNKISLGDNALDTYVKSADPTTGYTVLNDYTWSGDGYTTYVLNFTSQSWDGFDVRDNPVWYHELYINVPTNSDGSLSAIDNSKPTLVSLEGGDYSHFQPDTYVAPKYNQDLIFLQKVAKTLGQTTASLKQVPPSFAVNDLDEGSLVATGQKMFLDTNNTQYLVEFPIAKTISESFKVIDDFLTQQYGSAIDRSDSKYALTGASKRGQYSYLGAAVEYEKVTHLFPVVFDFIRMNRWQHNQIMQLGGYSFGWGFMTEIGVFQYIDTPIMDLMLKYVDPWCYRSRYAEKAITLAHVYGTSDVMMTMGGTDLWFGEFKRLYDQAAGESDQESLASSNKIFMSFIPNAGHDANGSEGKTKVIQPLIMSILSDQLVPRYRWWRNLEQDSRTGQYYGNIILETNIEPDSLTIFQATSARRARDWRSDRLENGRPVQQQVTFGNNDHEQVVRITSNHDSNYPYAYKARYQAPSGSEGTFEDHDDSEIEEYSSFFVSVDFSDENGNSMTLTTEPNIQPRWMPFNDCYGGNCPNQLV